MTAISNGLTAPRRGLVGALQGAMPRDQFFAGLYILGCANGLLGRIILSVNFDGWMGAITSIDINVIVLFACFAGISAMLSADHREEIRPADLVVGVVFLGLVFLPIFALSWVAVTGLSLYILLFANGGSDRQAWRNYPARTDRSHAVEPFAFSILCQAHFGYRCVAGSIAPWHRSGRQYGAICRWFGVYGRVASVFFAREHVSRIPVLDQHHAVGQAPMGSNGHFVVAARLRLGDCGQCHADQPHGHEPQPLRCDP